VEGERDWEGHVSFGVSITKVVRRTEFLRGTVVLITDLGGLEGRADDGIEKWERLNPVKELLLRASLLITKSNLLQPD
jgi:hypothetical protein